MTISESDFFSRAALLDRLTAGAKRAARPVVFLIGSAFAAPHPPSSPGVPTVAGMIDLIRAEFAADSKEELDAILASKLNQYQTAFSFLLARRGQNVVNDVIKKAVWGARKVSATQPAYIPTSNTDEDTCRSFDADHHSWHLSPAIESLGRLISTHPDIFGQYALTTNFDPLIEVGIGSAGGSSYRTVLHQDGNLGQTEATGCHVIHLHGYWYGAETLHTPRQLTQERPRLRASLARILKSKTLVVCGYGGWDDVFTSTLLSILQDDRETTEVIWTFFKDGPTSSSSILEALEVGLNRGVVTLYDGIDCHEFIPALAAAWDCPAASGSNVEPAAIEEPKRPAIIPIRPGTGGRGLRSKISFSDRDQDRPPLVDFYVGRSREAEILDETAARVIFITGIGGQGKSALAADYLGRHRKLGRFDHYVWRDCKEEGERFESQIVSIVYALGHRQVSRSELERIPVDDLIDLFLKGCEGLRILLVFDNVDHYIDLEGNRLLGSAARFASKILESNLDVKIIFTCRPSTSMDHDGSLELPLSGIDLPSTSNLFRLRGVSASDEEIERAHDMTDGHAFWLDLIAAQIGRNPTGPQLDQLLSTVAHGEAGLPIGTLQSIWQSLKEREQIVLRSLAEAVRPITALRLSDYVSGHLRWNQLSKAVKYLRGLNLIVVKIHEGNTELLELHPIIRAFVRRTFQPAEQISYVESILKSYLAFFGLHRGELSKRARPETIEIWLEAAEVSVQSERYQQAFDWLGEVRAQYQLSGHTLEFIRIADALIRAVQWKPEELPRGFDEVFNSLFQGVASMGRPVQSLSLLEIYKSTIPNKDARYINLCDQLCYYYWSAGDFFTAIRWGLEGVELKSTSGVDTNFDASHNLALAQRDSGAFDAALAVFLKGTHLETVVSEDPPDPALGGPYYGNIGRTLHLMGQIDNTLICYRKSALCIEAETNAASISHKGYIRQWVGELMYEKGDLKLSSACFSAALACWELIAPPRADAIFSRFGSKANSTGLALVPSDVAERTFLAWVRGVART